MSIKSINDIPHLPIFLVEYIENKIKNGKRGRQHLVKHLGTLEIVLEVLSDLWLEGRSVKEEARKLGVDQSTVYRLIKDIEPYEDHIINYLRYVEGYVPKDFRSYDSIRNWERTIRLSGHLSQLCHIRTLERICTGEILKDFKCSPDRFNLEKAQEFVSKYLAKYKKTKIPYHFRMAIRHFLASKEIVIPRGFGSLYGLSGEKESYGKYSHVKLSEDQIRQIKEIMENDEEAKEKGYDIAFEIGIQTCSRAFAIASLNPNRIWREEDLYIIEVFEPKIKENDEYLGYTGKWWRKYVTKSLYERIQEYRRKNADRTLIFVKKDKQTYVYYWLRGFNRYLKKVYKDVDIKEEYFYKRPIHALRHIGAHRLLQLTNYNYSLVAEIGGWTDEKTLKDCYGKIPNELITKIIRNLEAQQNIMN